MYEYTYILVWVAKWNAKNAKTNVWSSKQKNTHHLRCVCYFFLVDNVVEVTVAEMKTFKCCLIMRLLVLYVFGVCKWESVCVLDVVLENVVLCVWGWFLLLFIECWWRCWFALVQEAQNRCSQWKRIETGCVRLAIERSSALFMCMSL